MYLPRLGLVLILGEFVTSVHAKVESARSTQLSKLLSPTSPTANLIVFHSLFGVPIAVNVTVNPSISIAG